uniref:MATA-HMG n=1 Tax=Rhizophagus irregularis (strain DAOM 181602 / DAOM 197198 / MUCL 43194) TaxID=747089 RepID=U9TE43_RHIID
MSESKSGDQNQSQKTSNNSINNNNNRDNSDNNSNSKTSNNKPIEQELVFILENGTEPTPVRAIKRPEPQLHSPVHVPFPPAINAADLIRTNKSGALLARCTNKFLIYRNEFAREVRAQGYNLSMSEVSCLAAQAWKQEPNYVIRKYADIAHENIMSSPLTPLTPLTPTMYSPTFMYHPRISEVITSDIPLNATTMFTTSLKEERFLNNSANLEMISSYEIPANYCDESFSMPSRWHAPGYHCLFVLLKRLGCCQRRGIVTRSDGLIVLITGN